MKLLFALICAWITIIPSFGQNTESKLNKEIASSYIIEVVNKKKLNLIKDIYSAEYVFHGMDEIARHTIQDSSLFSFLGYLFEAFPDLHYTIDNAIAEGDLVALNLTGTATHKSEFMGYPASDKMITFKEMFFFRLRDKKC